MDSDGGLISDDESVVELPPPTLTQPALARPTIELDYDERAISKVLQVVDRTGAFVFGGYCRDTIKRRLAIASFLAHFPECDPKDAKGNFIRPSDLDVYIETSRMADFINELMLVAAVKKRRRVSTSLSAYNGGNPTSKLHPYEIVFDQFKIDLDLVTGNCSAAQLILPCLTPDASVNTLVYFKGEIVPSRRGSPQFFPDAKDWEILYRIASQIESNRCTVMPYCPLSRIAKMKAKGYFLVPKFKLFVYSDGHGEDDMCILCHERDVTIRAGCKCNVWYCGRCIRESVHRVKNCPTCRAEFNQDDLAGDIQLAKRINQ